MSTRAKPSRLETVLTTRLTTRRPFPQGGSEYNLLHSPCFARMSRYAVLVIRFCHVVLHVVAAPPAGLTPLATKDNTALNHDHFSQCAPSRDDIPSIRSPMFLPGALTRFPRDGFNRRFRCPGASLAGPEARVTHSYFAVLARGKGLHAYVCGGPHKRTGG